MSWREWMRQLDEPRAQLVILAVLAAVVAVVWATVFFRVAVSSAAPEEKKDPFVAGSEETSPQAPAQPSGGSSGKTTGEPDPGSASLRTEIFQLKDPFEPVLPPGGSKTAELTPETPSSTTTTTPGSPAGSSGGVAGGGETAPSGSTTTTTAPSGTRVRLDKIEGSGDSATATISVNGLPYQVKEGDDFAGSFRLVEIGSETVTLLRGDDRVDLAVSEEIVK